jgi:plastocyanin
MLMCLGNTTVALAEKHTVVIDQMAYVPANLQIQVGDTVTWINRDDRDHTVVASDGSFNSDNLKPGGSYSFRFTRPGRFAYSCAYHPRMKGSVTVTSDGK